MRGFLLSLVAGLAALTSVASAENFGKGYAPHFVVTVDDKGEEVLGVSVRGVRIDAGHTRDFAPQVVVVPTARGKQPDLNKPVVLSPEGRKVVEEQEKSFLQKYVLLNPGCGGVSLWRTFANELQVLVGVGDRGRSCHGQWKRREIVNSSTLYVQPALRLVCLVSAPFGSTFYVLMLP